MISFIDDDPDPDMDSFFGFNLNDEAEQDAADAEGKPDFLGGLFSQFVAQEGEEPSQFGALSTEQLLRVAMGYVPSVVRPHVKKLGALGTDLGKKAVDLGTQTGIIEGPIAAYLKENINEANLVFTEGGLRPKDTKSFDNLLDDAYKGSTAVITEYVNGDRELLKKVNDKSYGLLEYAAFGYINGKEPREYEASEIENEKNRREAHRKLIESRQFATEVDLKKALAELSTQATAWRYHVLSKGTVSTSMFCKGCNNSCLTLSPSKKCKNCDAVPSTVYSLTIAIERDEEKCIKALKERSWKVLIGLLKAGARSSKDFKIYLKTAIDDPEKVYAMLTLTMS